MVRFQNWRRMQSSISCQIWIIPFGHVAAFHLTWKYVVYLLKNPVRNVLLLEVLE